MSGDDPAAYSPLRPPSEVYLTARGLRHRILRWGPASTRPIVLLHGFLDTSDSWQFLVDRLPSGWAFAAPDWRGFGRTEWPHDGYWFADYFADLEALLDALTPGARARVVGHSMGGNVAALYAGIRPERLEWLVNLEGFGLPRSQPSQAPRRFAEWLDELRAPERRSVYPSVERFAQMLMMRNPRWPPDRARFIARAWTRPAEGGVELAADPAHRRVNPVLYRREEAEACWKAIRIPMLLAFGELSEFRPRLGPDGADDYFHALIAGVELVTLPGVGHMMHVEDPETVAKEIESFVSRHP
jgi:pimeloyl-ACP methyl ester carboxylesterase